MIVTYVVGRLLVFSEKISGSRIFGRKDLHVTNGQREQFDDIAVTMRVVQCACQIFSMNEWMRSAVLCGAERMNLHAL